MAAVIAVCTLALIYVQINWIISIYQAERETFDRKVRLLLENVVADIDEAAIYNPPKHPQPDDNGMPLNSYSLPIAERISLEDVAVFLQKECLKANLNITYDFAIAYASGEVIFSTAGFTNADPAQTEVISLFPRDPEYVKKYSLFFHIHQKGGFIRQKIVILIGVTVLLTLLIIGLFFYNLLIIFRQKQLTEIKNDFVNNMTHELKTPIATISLAAQMLNDPHISIREDKSSDLHQTILFESKRLHFLVEKVLQIAIFERGKLGLKYQAIDISGLLSKMIRLFTLQIEDNNIQLITAIDSAGPMVWADETHLTNVFTNLVDNAIKYRREQGAWIKITSNNYINKIVISIEDNGIGINKKNLKKIFTKFFRESTGNIHTVKGFGLGLNYVKQITMMLHGHIKVESSQGVGTKFIVTLPTMEKNNKRLK